jgi:hypothetical protein
MDGKTEGKRKEANKEKGSGKNSGGKGVSSAAPILGAVFGLLVKGVFSNALTLSYPASCLDKGTGFFLECNVTLPRARKERRGLPKESRKKGLQGCGRASQRRED